MDTKDLLKAGILLLLFFVGSPLLGLIISRKRVWQRCVFGAMCFMTISGLLHPAEWGLTLAFDPTYRGHARGFHFYFNEALALSLILASVFSPKTKTTLFPPGLWLYLLFCTACLLSYFNAPVKIYFWMAAVKAFKMSLFLVASYIFFREEEDLHFFLKIMSWTMLWEMVVVLKMKYVDELYQVWGTFEHQNPLCMYASMIGMVLLAAGAGGKHRNANLYLLAFIASGVAVQSSLSRAGLVIFAAATVGVMAVSLIDQVTTRRVLTVGVLSVVAAIGLAFTFDTIWKRFNEVYNINSNVDRTLLNKASSMMLRDYPLGIGWNNYGVTINHPYKYGQVIDDYYWQTWGEKTDKTEKRGISESHYWLLLAENGYMGLLTYLAFISTFLWWAIRAAWTYRRSFLGFFSLGVAMGFGVNYMQSLLERVLTQPRNMMLWMILLAATARIEVWRRTAKKEKRLARTMPSKPAPQLAESAQTRD